ncbi:MAG TPA: DnaJ domain-containing protein [Ohtaekwangia sp.]|uniref:DnaJ domain-containing protein n=1 Tax=Ohtaekwangia sp. TaxID=2066019 RepID=UPI002F937EFE
MEDYYRILGINPSANSTDIRAAYKKMAMLYHPDRNAGEPAAEEMFKKINEAYHVLSDPLKKSRYDLHLNPDPPVETIYTQQYEFNRRRYWQWQYAHQKRYKIDKEYFKIQALAFLVFIVIAGFCFAVIHTTYYFVEQKRLAQWRANSQALNQVNALFGTGKFDEAFAMVLTLQEKDPLELRFIYAHDSLITTLQNSADLEFKEQQFAAAVSHYIVLKKHEEPVRFETLEKIALCQYYLGNFQEAVTALKHLHNQQPENLQLIYRISVITLDKLDQPEEALQYLNLGKKLFKENLTEIYGEAFMIVMDPADAPDIYYDIFEARARANLMLKHFDDVKNDCNWAMYLRPEKAMPYKLRAQAQISGRTFENVCADLRKAKERGATDSEILIRKYCP